jgi:hypothetical protein
MLRLLLRLDQGLIRSGPNRDMQNLLHGIVTAQSEILALEKPARLNASAQEWHPPSRTGWPLRGWPEPSQDLPLQ